MRRVPIALVFLTLASPVRAGVYNLAEVHPYLNLEDARSHVLRVRVAFRPVEKHGVMEQGCHVIGKELQYPDCIALGGILLSVVARGRFLLEVKTQKKTFRWKPPLVVDKASKKKIRTTLEEIIQACEKSGLRVTCN